VMPNPDSFFDLDKTATITLTRAYADHPGTNPSNPAHWFAFGDNTATVTILQVPEFLGDVDAARGITQGNYTQFLPLPINQDIFDLGLRYGRPVVGMTIIDALPAAYNREVVFSIVAGGDGGLYEIDPETGQITFAETPDATFVGSTLTVKVACAEYPELYDLATVTFEFGWAYFVMCVDQPMPGNRDVIFFNGNVGHTFWKIEATPNLASSTLVEDGLRQYIDTYWGYYPTQAVNPVEGLWQVPGDIRNDAQYADVNDTAHTIDVYKKFDIASLEFFIAALAFTKGKKENPGTFHLMTNNCTTVAIAAAASAGIDVPKTLGGWTKTIITPDGAQTTPFLGYNPADMGEDLRGL